MIQVPVPLDTQADINRSHYIRVPDTNCLIAREQALNGYDFNGTLYKAAESKLSMPEPRIFMPYFVNVRQALEGKITLYDGNNKPLAHKEVEELHKTLYSNCRTWLNAKFVKGSGYLDLDLASTRINTETKLSTRKNKNIESTKKITCKEPLKKCINEDNIFVDLVFNPQGLPTRKSEIQEFKMGKNISFYHPRENCVAGFDANPGRVYLDCSRGPQGSLAGVGVFLCAEGTPKN